MIKSIKIENIKAIENLEASFNGGVYLVKGENDMGKSTILNIIDGLLTGNINKHHLLRNFEENGIIELETENFTVKCKVSKTHPNGKIVLIDNNTGMVSTQKSILQKTFSYNSFDAEEFIRWSDTAKGRRDQIDTIKSLYPVEILKRIFELDGLVESTKEARKPVNLNIDKYNSLLQENHFVVGFDKPINIKELTTELGKINEYEKAVDGKVSLENRSKVIDTDLTKNDENLAEQIEYFEKEIQKAKEKHESEKIKLLEEQKALDIRIENAKKYLDENKPRKKEVVESEIEKADTHNKIYNTNVKHKEYKEKLENSSKEKESLESKIESYLSEKNKLLKENNPVPGLTFDDEKLYLNGIPFDKENISDSEKLMVAFRIQTMKNPKSKIFLISRGESIGKKKMDMILKFAKENGYQGFIEKFVFNQEELNIEEYDVQS